MKKFLILGLLLVSVTGISATAKKESSISNQIDSLDAKIRQLEEAERAKTRAMISQRDKLEQEVEQLQVNYNGRVSTIEKLEEDSEVRWHRDEYKKILKKYKSSQDGIQKQIDKKVDEINKIDQTVSVMSID